MADKKTKFVTVNGKEYEAVEVVYRDKLYTLRELSVKENRDIEKAATDKDGKFDGQLNLVMSLVASIVAPPTTDADIDAWGGKQYLILSRAYNKLNSLADDEAGKN